MPSINDITVQDFKDQFTRGFNYLPVWLPDVEYQISNIVYYLNNFYQATQLNINSAPFSESTDWLKVNGMNANDYILDSDINNAIAEAKVNFNQNLFPTFENNKLAFLYLVAHYLVTDLNNNLGLSSPISQQIPSSQTVGNVSIGYDNNISPWYSDKYSSFFALTGYGRKYLSLIQFAGTGSFYIVPGRTNA